MSNYDRDEERRQERLMRAEDLFALKKQLDKDAQDPRVSDNLASTISKLESTIFKLTVISKELKILKKDFDIFSQSE
tara:strand:- start:10047 stop:10277 length:231 start_codon:yes stop_codon:yes gene_type:complete